MEEEETEALPTSNVVGAVKNATFLQQVVAKVVLLLNISAYELSLPPVDSRNAQYACQVVKGVSRESVNGTETVAVDMTKFIRAAELKTDPIIATQHHIVHTTVYERVEGLDKSKYALECPPHTRPYHTYLLMWVPFLA